MNGSGLPNYSPGALYGFRGCLDSSLADSIDSLSLAPSSQFNGGAPMYSDYFPVNWREPTEELRRLRARNVMQIDRMLRAHQPHDVLTQVPENVAWHTKTMAVAMKIERLMFTSAASREDYQDERTLRSRVQLLSRQLVRMRKRKNSVGSAVSVSV